MDLHQRVEDAGGRWVAVLRLRHRSDRGHRLAWRITVWAPVRLLRSLLVIASLTETFTVLGIGSGNRAYAEFLQGALARHRDVLKLIEPTRGMVCVSGNATTPVNAVLGIVADGRGGAGVVLLDPDEATSWIAGFERFQRGDPRHGGADGASGGATGSRPPLSTRRRDT